VSSKGKGKGKPPPPPSSEEDAEMRRAKAERDRIQRAEEKRRALAQIEEAREKEARERALVARLPTLTSCDVNAVPWDTALMHVRVKGGREQGVSGVDIVEFANGSAICLRKVMITEIVADRVAAAMDVNIAKMRIVKPSDREYDDISALRSRLRFKLYVKEPIMILAFVPGSDLSAAWSEPSQELFHGLGRLCALDMLLNNMDRVPFPLWDNLGNLSNVMRDHEGCPVGIDQQVNPISEHTGLEAYVARLCRLVKLVVAACSAVDCCDAQKEAVQDMTAPLRRRLACAMCGFEVSEAMALALVQGIGEGLEDAAKSWRSGCLQRALMEAEHMAEDVCEQVNGATEARMYTDFVRRVVGEVVSVLPVL